MGYAVKIKQEVKSWRKNKDYRRKEQEKDGERTALGEVGASVSTLENWGGRREGIFSTFLFIFSLRFLCLTLAILKKYQELCTLAVQLCAQEL